jgi:NADH dehydrogenase (ubiquinone) Fe-S protein 1
MPRLSRLEDQVDLVLLIGSNPRFEAFSFNVNLRRLVLRSADSTKVISIGNFSSLGYETSHFGNGIKTALKMATGKFLAGVIRTLVLSDRPVAVFGFENLLSSREDGTTALRLFNPIFLLRKRFFHNSLPFSRPFLSKISQLRSFNIYAPTVIGMLHIYASTPGACELGGISSNAPLDADCLYLIGADSECIAPATQTIYQGHHGDIGAKRATVILPSTAYSEKNGTYISLYHSIQQTKAAVQHCGEARDDCKIIHALADMLFGPMTSFSESTWPAVVSPLRNTFEPQVEEFFPSELCDSSIHVISQRCASDSALSRSVPFQNTGLPLAYDSTPENI